MSATVVCDLNRSCCWNSTRGVSSGCAVAMVWRPLLRATSSTSCTMNLASGQAGASARQVCPEDPPACCRRCQAGQLKRLHIASTPTFMSHICIDYLEQPGSTYIHDRLGPNTCPVVSSNDMTDCPSTCVSTTNHIFVVSSCSFGILAEKFKDVAVLWVSKIESSHRSTLASRFLLYLEDIGQSQQNERHLSAAEAGDITQMFIPG